MQREDYLNNLGTYLSIICAFVGDNFNTNVMVDISDEDLTMIFSDGFFVLENVLIWLMLDKSQVRAEARKEDIS